MPAPREELMLKSACCCVSNSLWCKWPGCASCEQDYTCLCLKSETDCKLVDINALFRMQQCTCLGCGEKDAAGNCVVKVAAAEGRVMCCGGQQMCNLVKPTVCCQIAGNCLFCDCRGAFPCSKEVPFEIGLLGIMCKKAAPEDAPAAATMNRA